MSQMPYTGESQRDEHNKDSNTKRVMLYGWDSNGLQAVRIEVDSSGHLVQDEFYVRNVEENSGNIYVCREKKSGEWQFQKISSTKSFSYATVTNNPTKTTYDLAYASYLDLTYEGPTEI